MTGVPVFRDEIFDHPSGEWVQIEIDQHFTQRFRHTPGPYWCETVMTVHGIADVEAAVQLIYGPWDWWEHGHIAGFTRNPDGSVDQTLSPVWWFITRVALHILPPTPLAGRKGLRVPILMTRHFSGPASMDIYPNERNDALIIRGRFQGVEYNVAGVPKIVPEWLHLDAESGTMPVPFPKGTGWVGLLHRLEALSGVKEAGTPIRRTHKVQLVEAGG